MAHVSSWYPTTQDLWQLQQLSPQAITAQQHGMTDFIDNHTMQLTVTDTNSYLAARVTLGVYGASVIAMDVQESNVFVLLNEDKAAEAGDFYNRLPRNMQKYVKRGSEFAVLPGQK